ncbi:Plasmodium variant antigen protein Cir/Yir/Bir, putative, partial [Plasmodium chabaudi chabaudi]
MTESSDNLKDLYSAIYTINEYFYVTNEGQVRVSTQHKSILEYCHYGNNLGTYNCNDYFQLTICSVIHLLKNYKKYKLEDGKLAEYVILWLSYKLNTVKDKCATNLNDFYTNHIEKNNDYNKNIKNDDTTTYKDIIDKIKDLMNIKEISKFNDPFSILIYLYNVFHDKRLNCQQYSGKAKEFVKNFETLNNDSKNIENSLYTQILSTLSNDYKNLKNKCPDFQSLPDIKAAQFSGQDNAESLVNISEGTSSSSSTLNTVIPVLSTFAIPVFLVVSYK